MRLVARHHHALAPLHEAALAQKGGGVADDGKRLVAAKGVVRVHLKAPRAVDDLATLFPYLCACVHVAASTVHADITVQNAGQETKTAA